MQRESANFSLMATRLNTTVAGEIRAELARQGRTQLSLASELSWSPPQLNRRLKGLVPLSLDDIEAIANALNVSIVQLVWPRQPTA